MKSCGRSVSARGAISTPVIPDNNGPGTIAGVTTKWIQQRLADLGYLPASAVTGHLGPWTRSAILAFQGWENLTRDAVPGPNTIARLRTPSDPRPAQAPANVSPFAPIACVGVVPLSL
jgi:peptidoglycan hydrolase-like protein with peptidoglycan-binding domain